MTAERLDVDFVHGRPLAHVGKEHRALQHPAHAGAVTLEHGGDVLERLSGLGLNTTFHHLHLSGLVADLTGQTFTLSNIGAVGGGYGTPIIPYGTTAILSIGLAAPAPVVRDGELAVGLPMPLSLSYDHRAIDGATGRAFMGALVAALEAPA